MLVRAVAALARRQLALEALLEGKGIYRKRTLQRQLDRFLSPKSPRTTPSTIAKRKWRTFSKLWGNKSGVRFVEYDLAHKTPYCPEEKTLV